MSLSRRQLIAGIGATLALPASAGATPGGSVVVVRSEAGLFAIDPRSGDVAPWHGQLLAAPAAATVASPVPEPVATPVTEGAVGYWMAAPSGGAWVFRIDTGASSRWWWVREGRRAAPLALPGNLEPALPSGTVARWFHGATVDERHLGAGTLRLLAVDLETGRTVLDQALDRRLELAATAVSDDGAIVGHAQGATTGVALWAADLRGGTRLIEAAVTHEPGKAAASAIDLDVAEDGDAVLMAAGLVRDWPGAPDPTVSILRAPGAVGIITFPGELVGISRHP